MWCHWASNSASFRRKSAIRDCAGGSASTDDQPLLIYVGRLDREKRPHVVVEAFRRLPRSLGAALLLLGDGPLREQFVGREQERHFRARLLPRPKRPRGLAGQRRPLCVGHGRRDIRHFDHRGAGIGPAGGRGRGRGDGRPRSAGLGLVGEVDDAGVMAPTSWRCSRATWPAMGERARAHALQFSWDQSMERLFGQVYRTALRRALAKRVHGGLMSRLVEA